MKILLTNDDGFDALGINTTKQILQQYGEVYTFAPLTAQSGAACGFTTYRKPINVYQVDDHNFKIEGTPVDCVLFANAYFQGDYDLIVSGCNNGYNMSNDTMYSGTCGACRQGLVFQKPCIALSAPYFDDDKHIKQYIPKALQYIFDNDLLSGDYYLNVSLNPLDTPFKGVKLTKLHVRLQSKYTLTKTEGKQYEYVVKHIHDDDIFDDDQYDVSAVHNGYISVTPVSVTTYKDEIYQQLKNKLEQR